MPAPEMGFSLHGTWRQVLHGCRQLVSCAVGLSPATSATPVLSCHRVMPGTLGRLPVLSRRRVGMPSSPNGLYAQVHTRPPMAPTKSSQPATVSQSQKGRLSSDCSLQLDCMKSESLVIAQQHGAVNTFPGLVHTARHTMGVDTGRRRCANHGDMEAGVQAVVDDWGEVVTR